MKTKFILFFLVTGIIFCSCKKEGSPTSKGEIKFCIYNTAKTNLKAVLAGPRLASILVSIENSKGVVQYNMEKMELFNFSGNYISNPVSFETGDYKLTYFAVLDSADNVLYAAPVAGSPEASFVQHPLSISFTVQKDLITTLAPEVLSTENLVPADFGYADFSFTRIMTFLISVYIYNSGVKNFELTSATLTISNGSSDILTKTLDAKTNQIPVQEGLAQYYLKIEKSKYMTYYDTLTETELKSKFSAPLMIMLDSIDLNAGLVAYYPFNGNANDESGNGNNGAVNGAFLTSDRNGKPNNAYYFNGIDSYIEIPSSNLSLVQYTYSFWALMSLIPSYGDRETAISIGSIGGDQYINYSNFYDGLSIYNGWGCGGYNDGARQFGMTQEITSYINQWYYLVATRDARKIEFYVNGILVAADSLSSITNPYYGSGIVRAIIGQYYDFTLPFNGVLDDIRIYNRALTKNEIQLLYNQ